MENFDELFKTEANIAISEVQQCSSPSFTWFVCSQSMFEMTNHCNKSRSGIPVEHLENPGHSPVNLQLVLCHLCDNLVRSKLPNWRYSSQVLHPLGGSEDPGWTLTFLIEPLGQVVAPPLFNNHAEGKVTTREHSVGGAMLNTCRCVGDDAFVVA